MMAALLEATANLHTVAEIALAGYEVYSAVSDEGLTRNERISKIFTSSLFIGAKAFQLGIAFDGEVSSQTRFAAAALGEGAAALKDTHQFFFLPQEEKKGTLDYSATLLMRITSVTNIALVFVPQAFGPFLSVVSIVSPPLQAGAILVLNRGLIERSASKAWSAIVNILSSDELPPGMVEIRVQVEKDPVLVMDETFAQYFNEIRGFEEASHLSVIPYLFLHDAILKQNRCTISNKPIRFLLAVSDPNILRKEVFFERDVILQLLNENSSPPQGWPEGVAFTRQSLHEQPIIQQQIDERLTCLLESFRHISADYLPTYNREIALPILITLAERLKLPGKTDVQIADLLMSNKRLEGILSSVKVKTMEHTFNDSYLTEATWLIECNFTHWIRPGKYTSDLEKAARAIFGSEDGEDLDALKIVAKNGHAIKIYLAQNFGRCEISVYSLKDFTASLTENLKSLPDAHIVDKIVSNIWVHPFISSVKVFTVNHQFRKARTHVKAKMIEARFCRITRLELPLNSSIAKAACRALLGSVVSEDLAALKIAMKIKNVLRIFFSLKDRRFEIQ